MRKISLLSLFAALSFTAGTAKAKPSGNMHVHVLRLLPGEDPKLKLEAFVKSKKIEAAVIVSAVGSLTKASIRFANQEKAEVMNGHFEIVSLSGTLSATGGSHLHIAVSDEKGKTTGGHLTEGSVIYTTLEVAIGEVTDVKFTRPIDPATTYKELKVN